jgi:hypothetical protein
LSIIAFTDVTWSGVVRIAIPPGSDVIIEYPQTFENEIILARCAHGAKADPDTTPDFNLAFDDIVMDGKPILGVLNQFADLVQRIVDVADKTFFR